MSIITIQALVWSYAESILIIESQTAWLILSHKGYLEVNLTWNSYNKLKILSWKRKRTLEMRFFKKKLLHYLWAMILVIFVLALLCPRRRFVTFRIIQQFFFSFYLRFSFSPLKSSNASMLITFQQYFFLFKHLQKYNLIWTIIFEQY